MSKVDEQAIRKAILFLETQSGGRAYVSPLWDLLDAYKELAVIAQPKPLTFPPGARRGVASIIRDAASGLSVGDGDLWGLPVDEEGTQRFKAWYDAHGGEHKVGMGSNREADLLAVLDGKPATRALMRWMAQHEAKVGINENEVQA